jgi:hypothetical protein
LHFGEPDVDAFLDRLAPEQFDEWVEFLELEPIGSLVEARQRATLVAAIAASTGAKIDDDELVKAWGFSAPERPLAQQDANARQLAGWGG